MAGEVVTILLFVIGAALGSAANALIDRLPRRESWVKGRSKCDQCGHELDWQDLVPIVSFLALRGRCRYCGKPIPYRNLAVEVFMGLAFVGVSQWASWPTALLLMGMMWVSSIIAVMDWETRLVSELLVVVWGLLVIADKFLISGSLINLNDFLGLAVGTGVIGGIWGLSRGKAMGFGDVEIAAVMGAWLGWQRVGVALWAAFVAGGVVGVIKVMMKSSHLKSEIAFGPFLVTGSWVAYLWGGKIISWLFP